MCENDSWHRKCSQITLFLFKILPFLQQIRGNISEDTLLFFQFPVVLPHFENPLPAPESMDVEPGGSKAENAAAAAILSESAAVATSSPPPSMPLPLLSSKLAGTTIATPSTAIKQEEGKGKAKAL